MNWNLKTLLVSSLGKAANKASGLTETVVEESIIYKS